MAVPAASTGSNPALAGRIGAWLLAGLAACASAAQAQEPAAPASAAEAFQPDLGPAEPFSFEALKSRAEALAAEPYASQEIRKPEILERIDYDAHWQIRFNAGNTVRVGDVPLQFFHLGTYFRQPVRISVVENGQAREVLYSSDYFSMPADSPAREMQDSAGFAGFRIMREDLETDWISFLGASYFRTDGSEGQYGMSARALAIDTGLASPEEFPRFTEFYIEDGDTPETDAIIYALLDSPSVAGAYRMRADNDDGQIIEVSSALYFRTSVTRLGIAPLTSMFWYSEANRVQAFDWRPEVHDSDGLAIATGSGERIWRPLNNPDRIMASSFADANIRGFGLLQRDRSFASYEDDGVFYDRRPSVWIETLGDWGPGAVQLVELPTEDEIYDNIVAYWMPADLPEADESMSFEYRLHWSDAEPGGSTVARTVATRFGAGGVPGQPRAADQIKIVIDFEGAEIGALTAEDGVEPVVTAGEGATVVNPYVLPVVGTERWRLTFDLQAAPETEVVEVRAYLRQADTALTETWSGQIHPRQILRAAGRPPGP